MNSAFLGRSARIALSFLSLTALASAASDYSTPYTFTTLAGAAAIGSTDGPGDQARFNFPRGLAIDSAGNLYVADSENQVIRKISPTGAVTTLAGKAGYKIDPLDPNRGNGTGGNARFSQPAGVTVDNAGNVFVAGGSDNAVRKITPAGVVTTVAGGSPGSILNVPEGVAIDATGTLYVADTFNQTIRKIAPSGTVTTFVGGSFGSGDGTGAAAQFYNPRGIALDSAGNLYVADSGNNTVRKITPGGIVTTLAGVSGVTGSADGQGSAASFNFPTGVAVDLAGNVFVADSSNSTVRKITPSGLVSTLAGHAGQQGHIDGGPATSLLFQPQGIAVDSVGNVYVSDTLDHTIRKITPTGVVSTLAGLSPFLAAGSTDGTGSAARFRRVTSMALAANGDLYVTDSDNNTVRKITSAGVVTTVAGTAGASGSVDGTGSAARFYGPDGIATDSAGNLYVSDSGNKRIRKITSANVVTTLAGGPAGVPGIADGSGSAARFTDPRDMTPDGAGNFYLADFDRIRRVTPAGDVTTRTIVVPGATDPSLHYSFGLTADAAGAVYVAGNHSIVKFPGAAGSGTTLAGDEANPATDAADGVGTAAHFDRPKGLAADASGNIYVADSGTDTIRRISPVGQVITLAGFPGVSGSADGSGSDARFDFPEAIVVDSTGTVYVASGTTIRKGRPAGPVVITTQPQSQTAAVASSVQFTVAASGSPAPTYQWYFNGNIFNGATSSTLNLNNVQMADAGDYTVVVSNSLGSVTSNKATLTVTSGGGMNPPGNGSSGGGGGAPSLWFLLALVGLAAARALAQRRRQPAIFLQSE
jgi:sugar lactone lactonase YvrE